MRLADYMSPFTSRRSALIGGYFHPPIVPVSGCSFGGLLLCQFTVVFFDSGHPYYRNFNLTWKLSEKLLTLKRNGHISETVYEKIRPWHKQPRRIYGLPNIPKADTPCRSLCYMSIPLHMIFSAFLANMLSPLTGNSNFAVKYLAHFASTIASEKIQENEIVVFFNLESLFTNVKM